jgi:hypothetical protein
MRRARDRRKTYQVGEYLRSNSFFMYAATSFTENKDNQE